MTSVPVPASVPVDDAIARAAAVLDHADPRTAHWLALYLDLHARPELSLQEVWTAGRLAAELRASGLEVTEGVGGTGVVGLLRNGPGPVVMLRGDMDGLPLREETGLPYQSRATGVTAAGDTVPTMHACGHDAHVTALVAAADTLAQTRDRWSGTLMIVGQPAEELAVGARMMLEDGLFTRFPKPDVALGQHVGPLPAGMAGHRPGLLMSAVCTYEVTIHGRGGHGSMPSTTVDPVATAAFAITRLQTIVSRETPTTDPVVVTVAVVRAGLKANIIPDTAYFTVNVRARSDESMARTLAAIRRIVTAECEAAGCPQPPTFDVAENAPATHNTPEVVDRVMAVQRGVQPAGTVAVVAPLMGSEDFSEYGIPGDRYDGDPVPYAFWFWGGVDAPLPDPALARGELDIASVQPSNHSALFAPVPDPTLETGRRLLTAAALAYLGG
jgi:hippurate hydrolase